MVGRMTVQILLYEDTRGERLRVRKALPGNGKRGQEIIHAIWVVR
jgi:hypothetical protein